MCVLAVLVKIVKEGYIDIQFDVKSLQGAGTALQFGATRSLGFQAYSQPHSGGEASLHCSGT